MKPVGIYNQVEQNGKSVFSMRHIVITLLAAHRENMASLLSWELSFLRRVR